VERKLGGLNENDRCTSQLIQSRIYDPSLGQSAVVTLCCEEGSGCSVKLWTACEPAKLFPQLNRVAGDMTRESCQYPYFHLHW
jgi:hypothetical protein